MMITSNVKINRKHSKITSAFIMYDNIKPVKGQNQRQRIDGAVSLLIAYTVLFDKMQDYQAMI